MHDLDRALQEFEMGVDALESGDYEQEYEEEYYGGFGAELDEVEEMELASALLEITDEQELEQFLGNLLKKAVSGVRSFASTPTGKALVGVLKDAAGKAIPTIGGAIGGAIGGSAGSKIGQQAGQWAKGQLGWEVGADQELEVAQGLVRVATTAAQRLAQAPAGGSPAAAAKQAAITAARQVAPQLTRLVATARPVGIRGGAGVRGARSGTWVRRGNAIILFGV